MAKDGMVLSKSKGPAVEKMFATSTPSVWPRTPAMPNKGTVAIIESAIRTWPGPYEIPPRPTTSAA